MTRSLRLALLAVAAVILIGALLFYRDHLDRSSDAVAPGSPIAGMQGQEPAAQIPAASYLMAHPTALKAAAKACINGSDPNIVRLCDRVHSAEAGLMAAKYRNGANAAPPPH